MTDLEIKKFEEKYPEIANYIKQQMQIAVKNICDAVINQYDYQISSNRVLIEKLKAAVKNLEIENWSSNTLYFYYSFVKA